MPPPESMLATPSQHCPSCRTTTDTLPSSVYRFVCTVCGTARVPLDDPSTLRSFGETGELQRAHRARRFRLLWQALGASSLAFGVFVLAATALVLGAFGLNLYVLGSAAALAASSLGLFFFSRFRAKRSQTRLDDALDAAWLEVAAEHARAHRVSDSAALAKAMHIDEGLALTLSAKLEVSEILSSPLGHDALTGPLEPPRLRVPEDEAEPTLREVTATPRRLDTKDP